MLILKNGKREVPYHLGDLAVDLGSPGILSWARKVYRYPEGLLD